MQQSHKTVDLVYAALFAALIGVLGFISIPLPFSPVPLSGQSLGIMLAGGLLTTRQAALSVLIFILVGAVGVPIFSGMVGGVGILVTRGGYYIGFLVGAILLTRLRGNGTNYWRLLMATVVGGMLSVYSFGAVWLSVVTGMELSAAIMAGVVPFIPGDLVKVAATAGLCATLNRRLHKI